MSQLSLGKGTFVFLRLTSSKMSSIQQIYYIDIQYGFNNQMGVNKLH